MMWPILDMLSMFVLVNKRLVSWLRKLDDICKHTWILQNNSLSLCRQSNKPCIIISTEKAKPEPAITILIQFCSRAKIGWRTTQLHCFCQDIQLDFLWFKCRRSCHLMNITVPIGTLRAGQSVFQQIQRSTPKSMKPRVNMPNVRRSEILVNKIGKYNFLCPWNWNVYSFNKVHAVSFDYSYTTGREYRRE